MTMVSISTMKMNTKLAVTLSKIQHNTSSSRSHWHWLRVSNLFPQPHSTSKQENISAKKTGSLSQKLMLQHQLIQGAASGTFIFLPFATRALEKLHRIIDEEMQSIGAQKMVMPILAPGVIWKASGRWEEMGSELLSLQDRNGSDHCLAPTHEEAVTNLIAAESPVSHKRLPIKLYQIGRKFRDERRPKNGLLRCREFEMKDLYTFDRDAESAQESYRHVCGAYDKLFERLGLQTMKVDASSGAMGGQQSQEFHLAATIGEDALCHCERCGKTTNEELIKERGFLHCGHPDCDEKFNVLSGIEVAHAFILGTKYAEVFKAKYKDEDQKKRLLYMGCYGIGVTRLLAAGLEVLSTDTHICWPRLLAPHSVCIIPQKEGYKSDVTFSLAESLQAKLSNLPNLLREVVLDDRLHLSIGKRVHQAKQLGYPHIIVLGKQSLEEPCMYEHIDVHHGKTASLEEAQLVNIMSTVQTIVL